MKHHHSFKRGLALLAVALSVVQLAVGSNIPLPSAEATSSITTRDLKKHLSFLASDEIGGRYTLSPGILIAARYLATELESYGYRGAARDGSFFQKVPLSYRNVDLTKSSLALTLGGARQEFKYADDFATQTPSEMTLTGDLVFVGYGVSSPKNNYDDYAGLDVKGKIVVLVMGVPDQLKGVKLGDGETGEEAAAAHGAAGVMAIDPRFLPQWAMLKNYILRESASLPPRTDPAGKVPPTFLVGPNVIKAFAKAMGKEESYLTASGGKPLKPAALGGGAEIKMAVNVKDAPQTQNVVAKLEGSDPNLKSEYVVFSAHYDHLRTNEKGEVFNGADDDGSGTVAVLEIAQAFTVGPRPKRSILVVFHTGEEMGLLGSQFNTDYEPVVPLSQLVADFNIDMIGRTRAADNTDPRDKELADKDSVYVIGADKLSTELNKISEQTNTETTRMKFDYTYNDESHPQRFYYRSDHYNYAKHGVPIIFYFTGVHRDYHRTTDDVEKIDFEKMERITRMVFATGWRVVNLDHRLVVDKKPAAQ
jgi:peptidase M28-like protein